MSPRPSNLSNGVHGPDPSPIVSSKRCRSRSRSRSRSPTPERITNEEFQRINNGPPSIKRKKI